MASANWSLPTLSSTYTNFMNEISSRLDDVALGLDTTATNVPTNAIKWSSASNKWQKWNGSTWNDLSAAYAITTTAAQTWATARSISITGDLAWTTSLNGSANVTASGTLATVNSNVGSFGSTSAVPIITVNAKGLITGVSTAALASMATQAANNVNITGGSISGITAFTVPSGTGSTTEGVLQWSTASDLLSVGTGAATKTFVDTNSSQTLTTKTLVVASNTITTAASGNLAATELNAALAELQSDIDTRATYASPTFTGVPAAPTATVGTNTTQLATTAFVIANAPVAFPSGTRMSFQQTAAPTGWTKDTTAAINDSAMRLVTGSVVNGGSVAFSTAFTSKAVSGSIAVTVSAGTLAVGAGSFAVGATTLSTAQLPSHSHVQSVAVSGSGIKGTGTMDTGSLASGLSTAAEGGGGSHTHSLTGAPSLSGAPSVTGQTFTGTAINLAVKYYDFIIASKN